MAAYPCLYKGLYKVRISLKNEVCSKGDLALFLDVFSAILFIHQIHFVYRGGGLLLWKVKVLGRT